MPDIFAARGCERKKEDGMQAYCVKCREKREMNSPHDETTKNGKPIIKGACPVCGTGLNIIGKTVAEMS